MSDRSIRRAAEREARKAARTAANLQAAAARQEAFPNDTARNESILDPNSEPAPAVEAPPAVSQAQLAANRENAQKSTGPITPEGKVKIRLNAVTTGLTGRTAFPPTTPLTTNPSFFPTKNYFSPSALKNPAWSNP